MDERPVFLGVFEKTGSPIFYQKRSCFKCVYRMAVDADDITQISEKMGFGSAWCHPQKTTSEWSSIKRLRCRK